VGDGGLRPPHRKAASPGDGDVILTRPLLVVNGAVGGASGSADLHRYEKNARQAIFSI